MSWLKKKFKKATHAVGSLGRAVDITYSKGAIGRYTSVVAKPIVQSTAVAISGGTSLLLQSKAQRKSAVQGAAIGAAIGGAIITGNPTAIANAVTGSVNSLQAQSAIQPGATAPTGTSQAPIPPHEGFFARLARALDDLLGVQKH